MIAADGLTGRRGRRVVAAVATGVALALGALGCGAIGGQDDPAGTLTAAADGASWTASFGAANAGVKVEFQVEAIPTTMTEEVTAPEWRTLATATADANGEAVIAVADPLEVEHRYRAVADPSGMAAVTDPVVHAPPRTTMNTGLPTIYFDTNEGQTIVDTESYVEGQFTMTGGSLLPQCAAVGPLTMKAKGRGNYTWELDKKPYNFGLDTSTDLCGMGKDKRWALLANHYDRSLMRTSLAMYLGEQLTALAWTPRSVPVDVYVNGSFEGSYTLIERVSIDTDRVDIPKLEANLGGVNDSPPEVTGGYLLEWDFRVGSDHNICVGGPGEVLKDVDGTCDGSGWVGIKEPEDEADGSGITRAQIDYIDQYLEQADAAIFGDNFEDDVEGWQNYIDADSAVDMFIALELTKNLDGNMYTSVFMYKERDTDLVTPGDQGKLHFGPIWDFDTSMGSALYPGEQGLPAGWYVREVSSDPDFYARQSDVTWFNRLSEDPEFQDMVATRWSSIYPQLQTSDTFIDQQESIIAASAAENFEIWDINEQLEDIQVVKGSWTAEVAYLRAWLQERLAWMDAQYVQ